MAIVTGGAGGIGRAIALTLAAASVRVCASYRSDEQAGKRLSEDLQTVGSDALVIRADVRSATDRRRLVDVALARWGRLDVLVNAAGINRRASFFDVSPDDFELVFATNVAGLYFLTQAAAAVMARGPGGRVINISSIAAGYALGDRSVYEASKAAVDRLTRSLAAELAPVGVRVNAVAPGLVETAMTRQAGDADLTARARHIPVGRTGSAEEIAAVVRFLALDAPDYLTGAVVPVDGGRLTR